MNLPTRCGHPRGLFLLCALVGGSLLISCLTFQIATFYFPILQLGDSGASFIPNHLTESVTEEPWRASGSKGLPSLENRKVSGVTVPSFYNDMLNAKQGGHIHFHLWHKTNIGPWMVIPLPFLVISSLFKGVKAKPVRQGLVHSNLRIIKCSISVTFMSTYPPGRDSNSVQCWDKVEME